jgi:hypothetical protein
MNKWTQIALVFAIPGAFLAASLGCGGLHFQGCTTVCSFLMKGWFPLISIVSITYVLTKWKGLLLALTPMSFVFLVPNCICYNPFNAWWIDLLGKSPACFGLSFAVSIIAVSALRTERHLGLSMALCWFANGGTLLFFVGHHYYSVPW